MNTRQIMLVSLLVLLVGALAVWWYFGFSLDFMRFFAAEPGVTIAPAADSTLTARATCQPRPACLDTVPSCDIAEPAEGWCRPTPRGIVACSPATQTVAIGASANLSATRGDGTYQWFAPDGVINNFGPNGGAPVPGNASVVYTAAGIKKVTVQSPRGDGTKNVDSVACTVVVTP